MIPQSQWHSIRHGEETHNEKVKLILLGLIRFYFWSFLLQQEALFINMKICISTGTKTRVSGILGSIPVGDIMVIKLETKVTRGTFVFKNYLKIHLWFEMSVSIKTRYKIKFLYQCTMPMNKMS